MLTLKTEVPVQGISGKDVSDFMINCTDKDYQAWWPGMHLAFHTIKRYPHDLGNLVFFDEYIGKRRLRFQGIVVKLTPGKEVVWQMKKMVKLPAWLTLKFEDTDTGVKISHALTFGFAGVGKIIDPLLRLFATKRLEKDLTEHAQTEFTALGKILTGAEKNCA